MSGWSILASSKSLSPVMNTSAFAWIAARKIGRSSGSRTHFSMLYVTKEDLVGHKLFISRRGVSQGVADWFGDTFDKIEIYATYNLLYNAAILVDSEIGAAICIEGAASLYHSPNVIFKPFWPELTAKNTLAWKAHQPMTRTVAKFIEFVKNSVKED